MTIDILFCLLIGFNAILGIKKGLLEAIFEFIDIGITVRGTAGMELPCFGKTTLTAGTGRYSQLGFTNDSDTKVEYLNKLRNIENLPNMKGNVGRPGLVHRIDKDTSGLLVVAKTEFAMAHLSKQFFDRTTNRKYLALVWGNMEDDKGTIEGNIGRSFKNRLQMDVFREGDHGKHAVTHYKVLQRLGYVTLVTCRLETGRTHQIRVHMKHIGHTLFNDERYGGNSILKGTTFTKYKQFVHNCFKVLPRQALHAKTLGFTHPTSGKFMKFNSEVPKDISDCLEKWRTYSENSKEEIE